MKKENGELMTNGKGSEYQIPGKLLVYSRDAAIALGDKIIQDHYWELYSEENIASITYENVEKLKFDGKNGSLTVTGKATINELLTANNGLTVNGGPLTVEAGNSLNAKGGASITGDLTVTGKATITKLLNANKGLTVSGGALTVEAGNSLNAKGGASITGDLTVTGKATITKLLNANKGLTVKGDSSNKDSKPLTIRATKGGSQYLMMFEDSDGKGKWHISQGPVKSSNDNGLSFGEAGVAHGRLFIKPGGNVGIDTTSPEAKLDVNGDLKVTGLSLKIGPNTELKDEDKLCIMTFGKNDGCSGKDYQLIYKAKGHFKKKTLAMHVHQDDAFGIYSSNWTPLLEVEGGSGNVYIEGNLFVKGSIGIICMWSGDETNIPKGWKLCDGKDVGKIKVPDLQSRFIIGAGEVDKPNTSGNASIKDLTISKAGTHYHQIKFDNDTPHGHGRATPGQFTIEDGAHSHDASLDDKSGDLRPKWYALCFIIYTGQ